MSNTESGKNVTSLIEYIIEFVEKNKNNDFWEYNLGGQKFEQILLKNTKENSGYLEDKEFFIILKEKITKIIGDNISIQWNENMFERCKTLRIKRIKNRHTEELYLHSDK